MGTRNVAQAARNNGVETFVLISTDKAVAPVNVMGQTKRVAEAFCQSLDANGNAGEMRCATVRFGNVLGVERLGRADLSGRSWRPAGLSVSPTRK